jgi:anaerobic magnesium-protoporphyrin IX monomethyl ester cyclase
MDVAWRETFVSSGADTIRHLRSAEFQRILKAHNSMAFTKLFIVNPPNPPGYVSNKDSMGGFGQLYPIGAPPFPPLDIPYLAASAAARAVAVEVIEAGALLLSTEDVIARLKTSGASGALVMVRTSLPSIDADLQFCGEVKNAVAPGALGLFGAAAPSLLKRIEVESSLDYVILGEADGPVVELMLGTAPAEIPGIMFRGGGRTWVRTPERPMERDLDSIPFPRWDMLPVEKYRIPKSSASGALRFLPILSSRGCPFGCNYCPYPIGQGLKWRFRTPKNVVDEMEYLVKNFGVEHLLFRDPMFSMRQNRVVDICNEITRRGLKVSWKCETRMDCLDEETIAAMARAGCVGVNFGVESIDPEIQKGVHRKPIMMDEFVEKVALCRKYDISTFAFFVVGLPGDTVDTILDSIEFAVKIRASWTQFTVATPFIGTPMHDWAVELGVLESDSYKIINAHTTSLGNENMVGPDIVKLHKFARLLQENMLNRRGILKNERRRSGLYAIAKRGADAAAHAAAALTIAAGRAYFKRRIKPGPNPTLKLRTLPMAAVGTDGTHPA